MKNNPTLTKSFKDETVPEEDVKEDVRPLKKIKGPTVRMAVKNHTDANLNLF